MDKRVSALAVDSLGNLYAGGSFTSAGGVAANYVARWDGTAWHPLGSGMGGCASSGDCVKALAVGGDGTLYAGGGFTTAGGAAANGIARWNGAEWQSLGSGMDGCDTYNGCVWSLAAGPDGSIYAGGTFTTAGGVAASNIARWDSTTSTWHSLGSGIPSYGQVTSLALSATGMLYVGGYFTSAGGVYADWIASWDGTWHALDSGVNNPVWALARTADGSIYAGGYFTSASGVPASHVARWDPLTSSWHTVGSGNGMSGGDAREGVRALTRDSNGVIYAGGDFAAAGDVAANRIARWDGAAWRPLSGGMSDRYSSAYVSALAMGSDGALYAGGLFERAGATWLKSIARWDGTEWQPLGDGVNGSVSALAADRDGNIYVGGSFRTAGDVTVNNIARWHIPTATWHALGGGVTAPDYCAVFALAIEPDGALYVGGYFKTAGDVPANHIARWDPATATWHSLGTGMNYKVHALVSGPDGSLYAGGEFTTAGDVAANGIARWDGTSWHPLGSGMGGCQYGCSVNALTFGPDGSLYAGGNFPTAGGVTVNHIARWDGASWRPLSSGMSVDSHDPPSEPPYVYALAFRPDGSLYAGGDFRMAGGVPSSKIARWMGYPELNRKIWLPLVLR